MYTEEALNECKDKLDNLAQNWKTKENFVAAVDANWVAVVIPSKQWRLAKKVGAKKDGYYGWILWSCSKNEAGSNFAIEARKIAVEYKLGTREYQL